MHKYWLFCCFQQFSTYVENSFCGSGKTLLKSGMRILFSTVYKIVRQWKKSACLQAFYNMWKTLAAESYPLWMMEM